MTDFLRDRYFITGLFLVLLFSLIWVSVNGEEENKENTEGIVHDVRKTENGFVFLMDFSDGTTQKCFSREKPKNMSVYRVNGEYSEDGSMFFVKNMILIEYT